MRKLILQLVEASDPRLLSLIDQLDRYLFELYPPEEVFLVDLEQATEEEVRFLLATYEGEGVGCGAYKPLHGRKAELKRVFVAPACRNQGIAGAIVRRLEELAMEEGYEVLKLETGDRQPEAVNFYKKLGYALIEPYGEYVGCPSSICMEKQLTP